MAGRARTLADAVQAMSREKRPRGRPRKPESEKLVKVRFTRLPRLSDAALEAYRKHRQEELGIPFDAAAALRECAEGFLTSKGYLAPPAPPTANH